MSDFDLAVGISGAELNAASQTVYNALYPNLFTGSTTASYQGASYTVTWNVQAAPQFDLAPGPTSFSVTFSTVAMTFQTGTGPATPLTLGFTADCSVNITGDTLTFSVSQVTAPTQSNPVDNYLVQNVVVPAIQALAQQLLSAITIPALQVDGVSLTSPAAGLVGGSLIATANVTTSGPPAPPDDTTPWPSSSFFALLGPNLVQALAGVALSSSANQFSGSGSGGDSWAGYNWSYSAAFADPQTSIQGSSVAMSFDVTGSVSGGVTIVYIPLDIGFDLSVSPNPSIVCGIEVQGSQAALVVQSVSSFTVSVTPTGSLPSWVLGWLIAAIVDIVIDSLAPSLTGFLDGLQIDSFSIPTFSLSAEGTQFTLTPTSLTAGNTAGYLALTGDISISTAPAVEAVSWRKSA